MRMARMPSFLNTPSAVDMWWGFDRLVAQVAWPQSGHEGLAAAARLASQGGLF